MRRAVSWVLEFLSILFNPNRLHVCRFEPSCGRYARQAVSSRGVFGASVLILKRLLRCGPWGPAGYDPLPEPKE